MQVNHLQRSQPVPNLFPTSGDGNRSPIPPLHADLTIPISFPFQLRQRCANLHFVCAIPFPDTFPDTAQSWSRSRTSSSTRIARLHVTGHHLRPPVSSRK